MRYVESTSPAVCEYLVVMFPPGQVSPPVLISHWHMGHTGSAGLNTRRSSDSHLRNQERWF